MDHHHRGFLGAALGLRQDQVGDRMRLLIHAARDMEIRKIKPRLRKLVERGRRRRVGCDQRVEACNKIRFLVLAPFLGVEQRLDRGGGALGGDVGGRQRQAAGPAEHHLVGADLDFDVVGVRMHHQAMDGFQQRQFDEILPLDQPVGRRRRGDHPEHVAGVGIDQAVQLAGIGERHADIGEFGVGDVAHHHQRQWRLLPAVGEGQRPVCADRAVVGLERGHLRAIEADADRLALLQRQPADIADDGARLLADRRHVERLCGIEYQPHRIGAAEQRRRGCSGKGERHPQPVAVAPRIHRGKLFLGANVLGCDCGLRRGFRRRRCGFLCGRSWCCGLGRRRGHLFRRGRSLRHLLCRRLRRSRHLLGHGGRHLGRMRRFRRARLGRLFRLGFDPGRRSWPARQRSPTSPARPAAAAAAGPVP